MRGKGFTLVELLVVISILSILMTIAILSYQNVQRNARDARRKSDISLIQSALEQYHADQGYYPLTNLSCSAGNLVLNLGCQFTNDTGTKIYIPTIPKDPTTLAYSYTPSASSLSIAPCNNVATRCINYCLYATMENSSNGSSASVCTAATGQYQVHAP